jgi:hypothetical protein
MAKILTVRQVPVRRGALHEQLPVRQQERPLEARTARACLSYFRQAGLLHVSGRTSSGEHGPAVTLRQEDVQQSPRAAELLARVAEDWAV